MALFFLEFASDIHASNLKYYVTIITLSLDLGTKPFLDVEMVLDVRRCILPLSPPAMEV